MRPFPEGMRLAMFGLGCFWGAEKKFWQLPGVYSTQVGLRRRAARRTPRTARSARGQTGHAEVVRVVFDPAKVSYEDSAAHRSGRATTRRRGCGRATTSARSTARASTSYDDAQRAAAEASRDAYQARLKEAGFGPITTEIAPAGEFYFAEDYHQQYLAKNPDGYCGLGGTGVACPVGVVKAV